MDTNITTPHRARNIHAREWLVTQLHPRVELGVYLGHNSDDALHAALVDQGWEDWAAWCASQAMWGHEYLVVQVDDKEP